MKYFALLISVIVVTSSAKVLAASHMDKTIQAIQSPDHNTHSCVFIKLTDVAEADPVVANNPWFTLHPNHPGFDQIFSMLLAAKMSNSAVDVHTTGGKECTRAAIKSVQVK